MREEVKERIASQKNISAVVISNNSNVITSPRNGNTKTPNK